MTNFVRHNQNPLKSLLNLTENVRFSTNFNKSKVPSQFLSTKSFSPKCWKCGVEKSNPAYLFCPKCNHIQAIDSENDYFKVFGLHRNFKLDSKDLTQKYRQMQSLLHPDKFTNKSSEEIKISEESSSLVNKAYNILQVPLKRAIHLLQLNGETLEEGQTVDDPEFLMEIMEINEQVEEATTPEKIQELNSKNQQILKEIETNLEKSFENKNIKAAKEFVIKMKYYNSVANRINAILRERGIVD